jgi:hypothetical protein
MDIFNKYKHITDKFESLLTIVVRNSSAKYFLEVLTQRENIIKNTKNVYKKTYRLYKIYNFILYIKDKIDNDETYINEKLCYVFLVGDGVFETVIKKKYTQILNEFNVKNIIIKNNNYYEIDYLNDLFLDNTFRHVFYLKNDHASHIYLNKTKKKVHKKINLKHIKLIDYINENKQENCLIHGISVHLKKIVSEDHLIFIKILSDDEIFNEFHKQLMMKNYVDFKKDMGMISNINEMHLVSYGKNIIKDIKNHLIKKIYCTSNMNKKINDKFQKYINFEIIIIDSLEIGDIADIFKTNYKGILGIKYY